MRSRKYKTKKDNDPFIADAATFFKDIPDKKELKDYKKQEAYPGNPDCDNKDDSAKALKKVDTSKNR